MKLLKSYVLITALFAGSFMITSAQDEETDVDTDTDTTDQSAQLTEYKDSLQQEYKNLRKLITTAAPKEVLKLNRAFKAIQKIENDHKIPALQRNIAELRLEACKKQQEDAEIKALIDESLEKVKEIEKITKPEQEKSNEITKKMQGLMNAKKSKDDPAVKSVEKELKQIQKLMREKSEDQIIFIQGNDEKIYKKMADIMQRGGKHMKSLKEKYTAAKSQIDPYDKTVANTTQVIEKALQKHEAKLKQIRTSIKDLRTKIYEMEPCFSAQEALDDLDKDEYNCEQLFIS